MNLKETQKNKIKKAYDLGGYILVLKECGIPLSSLKSGVISEDICLNDRIGLTFSEKKELLQMIRKTFHLSQNRIFEFEKTIDLKRSV